MPPLPPLGCHSARAIARHYPSESLAWSATEAIAAIEAARMDGGPKSRVAENILRTADRWRRHWGQPAHGCCPMEDETMVGE